MHQRHLETVQVELRLARTGQDARGAVVIRMDVSDHEPAQALAAEVGERRMYELQRIPGVHPAVEQIHIGAIHEKEHVDQAVLEWNRQPQLEDALGHLGQRGHHPANSRPRGGTKMGSRTRTSRGCGATLSGGTDV